MNKKKQKKRKRRTSGKRTRKGKKRKIKRKKKRRRRRRRRRGKKRSGLEINRLQPKTPSRNAFLHSSNLDLLDEGGFALVVFLDYGRIGISKVEVGVISVAVFEFGAHGRQTISLQGGRVEFSFEGFGSVFVVGGGGGG